MEGWWQRDQIISAFIIGGFSMTATLISMYVNARRAAKASTGRRVRRRWRGRNIGVMFVAGVVAGGVAYRFGASALGAVGMGITASFEAPSGASPARIAAEPDPAVGTGASPHSSAGRLAGTMVDSPDASPTRGRPVLMAVVRRSDWIRTTGLRIYYRYAERLPDACDGGAAVRGNWLEGDPGEPVRCLDSAWLVFDASALVESGAIEPDVGYCFNIRSGAGRWARHDAIPSPGLEEVAAQAETDALGSAPLGFRLLRSGAKAWIELTNVAVRQGC